MADTKGIDFSIKVSSEQAKKAVDDLSTALKSLKTVLGGMNAGALGNAMKSVESSASKTSDRLSKVGDSAKKASSTVKAASSSVMSFFGGMSAGAVSSMDKLKLMNIQLAEMKSALAEGMYSGTWDDSKIANYALRIQNLSEKIRKMGDDAEEAGSKFSIANTRLGGFLASLKRIAMYRIIRSIISGITQAIKEGISNMYEYSRVAGTEFAGAMNTAKSAMTTWKNSLAAAFAPLIEWVVPYLKIAVQWIVNLNNAIGAFFAAITGKKSYTAAIWYQEDYKQSVEGTTGAVKELQRYLAPFDELNVLPSDGGGGGGGGGGSPDYGDMFEERDLPDWARSIQEFLQTVKGWISDFWDWLSGLDFVQLAIAGWNKLKDWVSEKVKNLGDLLFPEPVSVDIPALVNLALQFAMSPVNALSSALEYLSGKLKNVNADVASVVTLVLSFAVNPLSAVSYAISWLKEKLGNINVDVASIVSLILSFAISPGYGVSKAISYVKEQLADISVTVPVKVGLEPEYEISEGTSGASSIEILHQQHGSDVTSTAFNTELSNYLANLQANADSANALNENGEGLKTIGTLAGVAIAGAAGAAFIGELPAAIASAITVGGLSLSPALASGMDPLDIPANANLQSVKDNIPSAKKELPTTSKFTSAQNKLTTTQSTIATKANFTSYKKGFGSYVDAKANLTTYKKEWGKYIDTKANLTSYYRDWSGGPWIDTKANLTNYYRDWSGAPWINAKANITSASASSENGIIVAGGLKLYTSALGGAFFGGKWHDIPQYAGGTLNAGSMFVAGEAGPELVGHINGRTEVLNASQIASAIAAGVSSATYYSEAPQIDEEAMYRAFIRALNDSDSGDIYLDGDVLYRNMVSRNRQNTRMTGVNAFA